MASDYKITRCVSRKGVPYRRKGVLAQITRDNLKKFHGFEGVPCGLRLQDNKRQLFFYGRTIYKKKLNTSTITENKRHFFIWKDNVQLFLFILAQSQREAENQKTSQKTRDNFLTMQGQITKIKCFQIQQARIQ